MDDALRGNFYSSPGLDGWMLTNLCAGMTDASACALAVQVLLMGPLRMVGFAYRKYFGHVVGKCKRRKEAEKRKE